MLFVRKYCTEDVEPFTPDDILLRNALLNAHLTRLLGRRVTLQLILRLALIWLREERSDRPVRSVLAKLTRDSNARFGLEEPLSGQECLSVVLEFHCLS